MNLNSVKYKDLTFLHMSYFSGLASQLPYHRSAVFQVGTKRKYLLANRIFMLLLPFVYFLFLWGPGTRGGIYLDYSQYPLGYLCLPSDQASM